MRLKEIGRIMVIKYLINLEKITSKTQMLSNKKKIKRAVFNFQVTLFNKHIKKDFSN
jgi:hypothetical protein